MQQPEKKCFLRAGTAVAHSTVIDALVTDTIFQAQPWALRYEAEALEQPAEPDGGDQVGVVADDSAERLVRRVERL